MSSIIEELWIFSKAGIPIVEISKTQVIDKHNMGYFISAMKSFSQEFSGEELKSLIMENNKFILKSILHGSAILVCRTNLSIKDKKIIKICNIISQIFEDLYLPEDLNNWNGDTSFFNKFKEKVDLYFKMSDL
jgi:hypothetical protein